MKKYLKASILGSCILFALVLNVSDVFAETSYDESAIIIPFTTINNAIVMDINGNGVADTVYSYSISSNIVTLTKILGLIGDQVMYVDVGTSNSVYTFTVAKDTIYVTGGRLVVTATDTLHSTLSTANATTGVTSNSTVTDSYTGNNHIGNFIWGSKGRFNEPVLHYGFVGSSIIDNYSVKNSTSYILSSYGNVDGTGNLYGYTASGSFFTDVGGNTGRFVSTNNTVYTIGNTMSFVSSGLPNCGVTGCILKSGTVVKFYPVISSLTTATNDNVILDVNINTYNWGLTLPKGKLPTGEPYWKNYLPELNATDKVKILFLHTKILDFTLTEEPFRFIMNINGTEYFTYVSGSNIKYTNLSTISLTNRASGFYFVDTNPVLLDNVLTSSPFTGYSYDLNSPTGTGTMIHTGLVSLISGYTVTPSSTISRIIDSKYDGQTNNLQPYILGSTSGQTTLSILIKNAPTNMAIQIVDSASYNSIPYIWSMAKLNADHTYGVDLPSSKCVFIYVRDLDEIFSSWTNLGQLCNSGTMPKTLVYSSNLSFTFWSLPYGTSHTFNNDNDILTTKIRHDTQPFNYTVKIYDSNGVEQYNQEFLENSTEVDIQLINVTGISKPSLLKVYDINGNQIYYSTLGLPSYLSGSILWFNTWLTLEGFNLLFMLPIVFGAMFTRNTVGIGTMSTVALIATLTWFGIIPIPDITLYLMIFIAVIGVIAYKKLYD